MDGDECSSVCAFETAGPICGNQICEVGENYISCPSDCQAPSVCGNSIVQQGEQCDDGNTIDGDGCSSTCQLEWICGNGIIDFGEECDDGNTISGDGCSSSCQLDDQLENYRVFVTSQTFNGNLGGLSGADAACQSAANNAGLEGTTWKAWLSDETISASDRLIHSGNPYKLLNEVTIANNWDDLTDGFIATRININEFGNEITSPFVVWTGTTVSGGYAFNSCNNWLDGSIGSSGTSGGTIYTNSQWTNFGTGFCSFIQRLYCVEQ